MAGLDQAFPRLDTQAVDPKTGRLTQPWYRFFISLWTRSGGGTGFDISGIDDELQTAILEEAMGELPGVMPASEWAGGEERFDGPDPLGMADILGDEPSDRPVPGVRSVAVTASPAVFTANMPGSLLISGGVVTSITLTRGGSTVAFPMATGVLPLSQGDGASVAFSAAPTLTFIPR